MNITISVWLYLYVVNGFSKKVTSDFLGVQIVAALFSGERCLWKWFGRETYCNRKDINRNVV